MSSLFEASAIELGPLSPGGTAGQEFAFDISMSDVTWATVQWARESVNRFVGKWLPATSSKGWGSDQPLLLSQRYPHLEALAGECHYVKAMDKASLLDKHGVYPDDHLFKALVRAGMLIDHWTLFRKGSSSPEAPSSDDATLAPVCEAVGLFQLGKTVCGHVGIVHGGLTSALIDEMCGAVLYLAKHHKLMMFNVVLTANLDVQYKQPLTPDKPVLVTATISQVVGRKVWVEAVVSDLSAEAESGSSTAAPAPSLSGSKVYATAKALFIIPRPEGPSTATLQQAASQPGLAAGQMLGYKVSANEGNPSDV